MEKLVVQCADSREQTELQNVSCNPCVRDKFVYTMYQICGILKYFIPVVLLCS